ncbi:hypothetical protein I6A84_03200 [Frankia sp. CNm7]|uniref:Uncharacterized protein n=1 Tax=Frankia nepalensis TaxID=1836974 RepID=A0A937R970_9ACTN|nr:CATRA conflict system CASPASE/TPR repeat-associated protein [Frankia nepalensis]MBL7501441.1 hypothetical protein [Frankia nepalensis]MBL7509996.1 hypothetical protein [Frankia nepalensis]MBL7517154.1 hypothetical protein [Frankia nepalensis]MBL7627993.1 hypothetical protein [Frankia nepalensis]
MTGPSAAGGLAGHELVVQLFAPVGGPGGAAAAAYLREVWDQLGRALEMNDEVPGLGLPAVVRGDPESWPGEVGGGAVAACGRPGRGVFQAVLRRHHDAVNLAVVLAPQADEGLAWRDLEARWASVAGDPPAELLGVARIYVGHVARARGPAEPTGDAVEALAGALPTRDNGAGWTNRAAAVVPALGSVLWETSARDDHRAERAIAVLRAAGDEADARLSAWVWSDGTATITPFARYLLHAAKARYHLRVWKDDSRALRELRHEVDRLAAAIGRLLDQEPAGRRADGPPPARPSASEAPEAGEGLEAAVPTDGPALRWALRASTARLVDAAAMVPAMRRSVEIAAWNMDEAVGAGRPAAEYGGLFQDDARLVEWFLHQLADDHTYLETRLSRVTRLGELARDHANDRPTVPGQVDRDEIDLEDVDLGERDRELLLRELATRYRTQIDVAYLLTRLGLERQHWIPFTDSTPLVLWATQLTQLEDGRVPAPRRRLIEVVGREFPSAVIVRLAARYGVVIDESDDS